jgi:hypothetical protein
MWGGVISLKCATSCGPNSYKVQKEGGSDSLSNLPSPRPEPHTRRLQISFEDYPRRIKGYSLL